MTARRRNPLARGPRLARWLLLVSVRTPGAEAIVGDIEEGYAAGRSLRWYWAQVLGSVFSWWAHSLRSAGLAQDARMSARKLIRRPGFSIVVALSLALGIGANAAIFSVVNDVLLSPLPYPDPERLVVVRTDLPAQGVTSAASSPPELADIARDARSFESIGGIWYRPAALTDTASFPEDIDMAFVSAGLLPALGVEPMLGRHPLPEEDLAGGPVVIVLSEQLWRRRYGADPDIVGTQIELDSETHTVVGVMPRSFEIHLPSDIGVPARPLAWVPFGGRYDEYSRSWRIFTLVGRLAPGATLIAADEDLAAIATAFGEGVSAEYASTGFELRVEPLGRSVVAHARPLLLVVLGAVGLLLLIVCANVANLYLARAGEARRDVAVRQALGASSGRLIRAVFMECALITALGATAGVLVAQWVIAALPLFAPAELPRINEVSLDLRVIGFAAALAAATALIFAAVSALGLRPSTTNASSLRAGPRASGPVATSRLRGALLITELALSLMLLIGVGLMVRSFANLAAVDTGFEPEGVVTIRLSLVDSHFLYSEPEKIADFYRQLGEQVAAIPGVDAAGVTSYLPSLSQFRTSYAHDTVDGVTEWGAAAADYRHITPGWMEAVGARLVDGRLIDWQDDLDHSPVVIVDDKLAATAWPGENAIGKRLEVELFLRGEWQRAWAEVVGVVQHLRHDPASEGIEQIFVPHRQSPMRTTVLTIRTANAMAPLVAAVGEIVRRIDGDQPIGVALPMTDYVAETLAAQRFALTLLSSLSALALALAVVGTYGVVSYGVAQRTREIGIQLALGASPAGVVRSIVVAAARLATVGIGLGIAGALALARFLSSLLYEVAPTDPATFAALSAAMTLVTLAACYFPARRAARLDPTLALRSE